MFPILELLLPPRGGIATTVLAAIAGVIFLGLMEYMAIRDQLALSKFDQAKMTKATVVASSHFRPTRHGPLRYNVSVDYSQIFAGNVVQCKASLNLWGEDRDFDVGSKVDVMVAPQRCGQPSAREEYRSPGARHAIVFGSLALLLCGWLFYAAMERSRREG